VINTIVSPSGNYDFLSSFVTETSNLETSDGVSQFQIEFTVINIDGHCNPLIPTQTLTINL
jgi:hypothetical protein